MYVVIDSCVWVSELGLSSSAGSAVRYFLKHNHAVVAVPEVVSLEVAKILARNLLDAKKQIHKSHRQLLAVFGELTAIDLPTDAAIYEKASALIGRLDVRTQEIPFSLDSARSSLAKVVDGVPPSGPKNQQFKDGVIWADCLTLLNEDDVHLVSTDKGFFQQRKHDKGLAHELDAEAQKYAHNLTLHSSLRSLLQTIRSDISVDPTIVVDALLADGDGAIQRLLAEHGFDLGAAPKLVTELFFTESADVLYAQTNAIWSCEDATPAARPSATLTVKAEGTLNRPSNELSTMSPSNVLLEYTDENGEPVSAGFLNVSTSLHGGIPTVRHAVRRPSADH